MAGQFSPSAPPVRSGAYFNFQAQAAEPTLVNALGVVAVPFTHSWGPENKVVTLNSWGDFIAYFGQGGTTAPTYTAGYKAVKMAFTGEGLPGRGGAGQVLAYRMVTSAGAAASGVVQNTSNATALTLVAVYKGSYGNKISYTVAAADSDGNQQVVVLVDGFSTETYTLTGTDTAALVTYINANSSWVTAVSSSSGTALKTVSSALSLSGGNDGSAAGVTEFTNMMTAFSVPRFSLFAAYDLSSDNLASNASSVLTSLLTWGQGLNTNGKRCVLVTGGPLADTAATATTRAAALNDPNFVTVGIGTFKDSELGTLSTAQLAPRLAGIMAARSQAQGLSFARCAGLSIVTGPADSDILTGIKKGFMTLGQDSNSAAPVRFEKGLTTWTTTTDAARPYKIYSNPKFVRTMQMIETDITQWAEGNVIGFLPMNDTTTNYVIGTIQKMFKGYEGSGAVLPGWTVGQQMNPPPTSTDDFLAIIYQIEFMRDLEKVLNTVIVG